MGGGILITINSPKKLATERLGRHEVAKAASAWSSAALRPRPQMQTGSLDWSQPRSEAGPPRMRERASLVTSFLEDKVKWVCVSGPEEETHLAQAWEGQGSSGEEQTRGGDAAGMRAQL